MCRRPLPPNSPPCKGEGRERDAARSHHGRSRRHRRRTDCARMAGAASHGPCFVALDDPHHLAAFDRSADRRSCIARGSARRFRYRAARTADQACRRPATGPSRQGQRQGGDRLDRARRRAVPERRGQRHGDQPDQQGRAVRRGLRLSRPYRVPRRADQAQRQADHDAGKSRSARRAGHRARFAAQLDCHAHHRRHHRRRAHHGRRAATRIRHRTVRASPLPG